MTLQITISRAANLTVYVREHFSLSLNLTLQGEFILVSDRQSDASFLIHHFLSLFLRGELHMLSNWEEWTNQVCCRSFLMPPCCCSSLPSPISVPGAVLQPLQCCQSETGEFLLWIGRSGSSADIYTLWGQTHLIHRFILVYLWLGDSSLLNLSEMFFFFSKIELWMRAGLRVCK